jgi:hypothetical protein
MRPPTTTSQWRVDPMKYSDNARRTAITAAVVSFGCAIPQLAMAQAANSLPDGPVACGAFQRVGKGRGPCFVPRRSIPTVFL